MMKIGVTCNYLKSGGGGMERQAFDIIEGLLERGFKPTVFTKKYDPALPLARRLQGVVKISPWWLPNKLRDPYFSRAVDRERRKARLDLVIALNRIENSEIVVSAGPRASYLERMGWRAGWFDHLHIGMEKKQFGGARYILAPSGLVRDELVATHGLDPERIRVFYPAVDRERFRPAGAEARRELRRRFGFPEDRKVFLFPSQNHVIKGLPFLREFFERTDLPVELVVVGKNAKAGRNVRSLGYSTGIEKLYQAADVTILASRYETFGLVAVESVLCGTPVIFSERAGCCEVLEEPALYRIRPDDPATLAAAVGKALAWDRGAGAGRDLARHVKYDCDKGKFVDGLLELL